MSEIFIQTFFLYFIVIDPLGNTPLFLSITQHMEAKQKIKVALSATIIATIILLFFALLGSSLLSYLHISYPAFTIGGGIILLIIAIEMLFDKRQQRKGEDLDLNSDNVSIFPLATQFKATPPARHKYFCFVTFFTCLAILSTTSSVTSCTAQAKSISL